MNIFYCILFLAVVAAYFVMKPSKQWFQNDDFDHYNNMNN